MAREGFFGWLADLILGEPSAPTRASRPTSERQSQTPRSKNAYRPRSTGSSTKERVVFREANTASPKEDDLSGLNDALTGVALNPKLGLHQCQNCKVFYHTESITVLRELNGGKCVACSAAAIAPTGTKGEEPKGRNFDPDVVTLANYQQHVGRVVTFEGRAVQILSSRRGGDYAVMFEDKSWTKGFKVVFFRGALQQIGGQPFLKSLAGRKLRVRGLLIQHPRFGYEVIVSDRSMIEVVR